MQFWAWGASNSQMGPFNRGFFADGAQGFKSGKRAAHRRANRAPLIAAAAVGATPAR